MVLLKNFYNHLKAAKMSEADLMRLAVIFIFLLVFFAVIGFLIGLLSPLSIKTAIRWSELVACCIIILINLVYFAARIFSAFNKGIRGQN